MRVMREPNSLITRHAVRIQLTPDELVKLNQSRHIQFTGDDITPPILIEIVPDHRAEAEETAEIEGYGPR